MGNSGQKKIKKNKLTEQEAESILYNMWENMEVPSNFTEDHGDYREAVKQTMELGYLIPNYFFDEIY
jgi:hypothetical protein